MRKAIAIGLMCLLTTGVVAEAQAPTAAPPLRRLQRRLHQAHFLGPPPPTIGPHPARDPCVLFDFGGTYCWCRGTEANRHPKRWPDQLRSAAISTMNTPDAATVSAISTCPSICPDPAPPHDEGLGFSPAC